MLIHTDKKAYVVFSLWPVSYTHLDVYKRQSIGCNVFIAAYCYQSFGNYILLYTAYRNHHVYWVVDDDSYDSYQAFLYFFII